jgi:hypothetical protein
VLKITVKLVEILYPVFYNTSTKRSSNYAPFDKVSKSGDGGCSGGIFSTVGALLKKYR